MKIYIVLNHYEPIVYGVFYSEYEAKLCEKANEGFIEDHEIKESWLKGK